MEAVDKETKEGRSGDDVPDIGVVARSQPASLSVSGDCVVCSIMSVGC